MTALRTTDPVCLGKTKSTMTSAASSQAIECVYSSEVEPERAEAIAMAKLTPMMASLEAPRSCCFARRTANGVNESASDSTATSQSGEDALLEDARAART
jgi:hypothetical protein